MSEVVLFHENLEFTLPESSGEIVDSHIKAFLAGDEGDYGSTFEASREIFINEREKPGGSAYFVPAVRFLVKTGLELLQQSEVEVQLPGEVEDRYMAANLVVRHLSEIGDKRQVFRRGYLASNITPLYRGHYDTARSVTIANLADAAFMDASMLAGGALKLLKEETPDSGNHTEIIQGSHGLLKMSAVTEDALKTVHLNLGRPYVHTRNLRITKCKEITKVRFAARAADMIKRNIERGDGSEDERGCPVGKIKTSSGSGTILQEDWRGLVAYLAPATAEVENYTEAGVVGVPV